MPYVRHPSARAPRAASARSDTAVARIVLLVLLAVPAFALWQIRPVLGEFVATARDRSDTGVSLSELTDASESSTASSSTIASLRALFKEESTRHFLPPPVAVLPPETEFVEVAPPPGSAAAVAAEAQERVKVTNTGGLGAVLRAEPPRGRQIAALRDGTVLTVLERQEVGDGEWLRVRIPDGTEGWIYGRLVSPA